MRILSDFRQSISKWRWPGFRSIGHIGRHAGLALGAGALALIWLGTLFHISMEYEQTGRSAQRELGNLATLFEEQLSRVLGSVDQTLKHLRASYVEDPDNFDIVTWSARVQAISDFSFQTVIIGADGFMVASSISGSARLDLSDREHFRVHADRTVEGLFVSKPIVGRVSNRAAIQMSRRIENADGNFAGVAVMSIDPEYLSRFYGSIDLGGRGAIMLVGTDAVVRVRKTPDEVSSGMSMAKATLFKVWKDNPKSGVYIITDANQSIDTLLLKTWKESRKSKITVVSDSQSIDAGRMVAFRKIKDMPLIVTVASGLDDIFAGDRREQAIKIILASLLSLCILTVTFLIIRYQSGLALARDAAEAGTRARSTFLAAMSHEIRTPMNAVLGLASSLVETPLNADQRRSVAAINESGGHLLRILNDILDFSKMEAAQVQLERTTFSPEVVAANVLSVIGTRAQAKGLTLTLDCSPDLPVAVVGDASRISQILMNLVSNAVKFTERGTVAVKVECLDRTSGNAVLKWSVVDSGCGIPVDRIGKLFGEFVQADNSIARRYGGSGLGLAICKRLVKLMDGDIGVASQEGQGSDFWIRLTLPEAHQLEMVKKEAQSDNTDALKAAIEALGRPAHVLLAEDNATNQLVVAKMLESFNIALTVVADGAEAVEAVSKFPFDIVFMDMCMPNMDGLQAAAAIRARGGALAQLPIVALTANVFPEDIKACRDAGMGEFIAKPMRKRDLVEAMARALSSATPVATPALPAADAGADKAKIELEWLDDLEGEVGLDGRAATVDTPAVPAADAAADKADIEPERLDDLEAEIGLDGLAATLVVFLRETEARLRRFETLSCDKDRATIKGEAHTLKGASATVGLARLAAVARELESTAAEIASDRYVAAVERLNAVFAGGRGYLDRRLAALHVAEPQESQSDETTLPAAEQKPGTTQHPPKRQARSKRHAGKPARPRKFNARKWEALERAALKERLRIWKEQGRADYQRRLIELSASGDHEKVPPHLRQRLEWQFTRARRDLRDPATGKARSIKDVMATGEYDPINPKHRLSLNKYEKGNRSHHPPPDQPWRRGTWALGPVEKPCADQARDGYDYADAWPERRHDNVRTDTPARPDPRPRPRPARLPDPVASAVAQSGSQAAA